MTLTERSTSGILTTQANARAIERQRSESNRFSERPIDGQLAFSHLRATRELAHHFRIQVEAFRHDRNLARDLLDHIGCDRRLNDLRAIQFSNDRLSGFN